jgi:biotin transport system substrate-specific component
MENSSRTRGLVLSGLAIALLTVGAFVTVPFGPVPFTLQTLMLAIVICILSPKQSVVAVGGYLLLGAIGLPIFAGMRGGIGVFAGPTGGFLIGFLLATIIIAILRSKISGVLDKKNGIRYIIAVDIASVVILSLVYYTLGCIWFSFVMNTSLDVALASCVAPFVIPDVLKAIAAVICVQPVRLALGISATNVA